MRTEPVVAQPHLARLFAGAASHDYVRHGATSLLAAVLGILEGGKKRFRLFILNWLPPRDSNPDMLIQSQLSYH